ncbi:MAG TPA: Fur family transcriptional regulator [Spirochaetota bacterium]|nr:Fur family transcriptional regulator [Spirochaetota bacterium]
MKNKNLIDLNWFLKEKEKIFLDYLTKNKMNITLERKNLFKIIATNKFHFSINDLIELSKKSNFPSSRATVYRTVNILSEIGLLKKIESQNGKTYYENIEYKHNHLCCSKCGKIVEFYSQDIEKRLNEVYAKYNFRPFHNSFSINGLCKECEEKEF